MKRSTPRRNMQPRRNQSAKVAVPDKTGPDAAALEPSINLNANADAGPVEAASPQSAAPDSSVISIIQEGTRTTSEEVVVDEEPVRQDDNMVFIAVRIDPNLKGMLKAEQWEPYIESGWKLEKGHPDSSEDIAILSMSKQQYGQMHVRMDEYYDRVTDGREISDEEIAKQSRESASTSRRTATLRSETIDELLGRMPATPDDLTIEKLTNPDFENPDVGDA